MNITFWQNIISPHQTDFLEELSKYYKITLIVERDIDNLRKLDGWVVNYKLNFEVLIKPSNIHNYFKNKNSIHIFSSISSYPYVYKAFKLAVLSKVKIGLMSEPMNWLGLKGKLRFFKGRFEKLKYEKQIDFILSIGNRGSWWYHKLGYPKNKVFDFGYFVKIKGKNFSIKSDNKKLIYVGRLNDNKGVFDLIKALQPITHKFESCEIYGRGEKKEELLSLISKEVFQNKIKYKGLKPNDEVLNRINASSLLIIPSRGKDGWGVVVNEALLLGTPVIASNNVGSSYILDGQLTGESFEAGNVVELEKLILKWLESKNDRKKIREKSKSLISVEVAVSYFNQVINYVYNKQKHKPIAPWLTRGF